ncbi:hypothetical protein [Pantoea sp. aB]|jgi:hypothetical protein|uniref:hypothetical protein n=1 Tax=Pantoea sp. aB TaxID=517433 RepID=UPI0001E0AC38|nr:hypothetical protein [Pantoea sp. aB]EFM17707.1 hypothetical protein PanABDRAFT_4217 [Pantoea sp. aB]
MNNFAQRDFVNATSNKALSAIATPFSNVIGRFLVLCFSTLGIVYSLAFMWMAHQ